MAEPTFKPRKGLTPEEIEEITYWNPIKAPDLWLGRQDAADILGVNVRSVDRYVRLRRLTGYLGPVPGSYNGVRVLKSEIDSWGELRRRAQ